MYSKDQLPIQVEITFFQNWASSCKYWQSQVSPGYPQEILAQKSSGGEKVQSLQLEDKGRVHWIAIELSCGKEYSSCISFKAKRNISLPRGVVAFLVMTTTLAAGTHCPSRKACVRIFRYWLTIRWSSCGCTYSVPHLSARGLWRSFLVVRNTRPV